MSMISSSRLCLSATFGPLDETVTVGTVGTTTSGLLFIIWLNMEFGTTRGGTENPVCAPPTPVAPTLHSMRK